MIGGKKRKETGKVERIEDVEGACEVMSGNSVM